MLHIWQRLEQLHFMGRRQRRGQQNGQLGVALLGGVNFHLLCTGRFSQCHGLLFLYLDGRQSIAFLSCLLLEHMSLAQAFCSVLDDYTQHHIGM